MMEIGDMLETVAYCRTPTDQNMLNVLNFEVTAKQGDGLGLKELADALSTYLAPVYLAVLPAECSYDGIKARRFDPNPTQTVISQAGAAASASLSELLPTQSAGLISLRSLSAPLRTRGRCYLPAAGEDDTTAGSGPSVAFRDLMQDFANAVFMTNIVLTAGANGNTLRARIWSVTHDTKYSIDYTVIRTSWATQRRRSTINRGDSPLA